ncbi:MAG: hypothetical protein EOO03_16910, partial [Chitinophagaceae bacterium]
MSFAVLMFCTLFAAAETTSRIDLATAASRNEVAVKAVASGLSSDNLRCTITNKTNKRLHVRVAPGLHFVSSDKEVQDLFTYQEMLVMLAPGASNTIKLSGFCMERSDSAPGGGETYVLKGHAGLGLHPLGDSLQKYPRIASGYGQMFVWSVTDRVTLEDITVAPEMLAGGTNIMHYVSKLTGLTPGRVTVSPNAKPTVRTFSRSTIFSYHSPVSQTASLKVYDEKGREFSVLFKDRQLLPGVVRYTVN